MTYNHLTKYLTVTERPKPVISIIYSFPAESQLVCIIFAYIVDYTVMFLLICVLGIQIKYKFLFKYSSYTYGKTQIQFDYGFPYTLY